MDLDRKGIPTLTSAEVVPRGPRGDEHRIEAVAAAASVAGGAELVAAFLDSGQVDEFVIHVIPKMIGEGIPLLAPRHRDLRVKLLASKRFPDGVVKLHYAVRVT